MTDETSNRQHYVSMTSGTLQALNLLKSYVPDFEALLALRPTVDVFNTREELVERLTEMHSRYEGNKLYGVAIAKEGEEPRLIFSTGNGPDAEGYARFFAILPLILKRFVEAVEIVNSWSEDGVYLCEDGVYTAEPAPEENSSGE